MNSQSREPSENAGRIRTMQMDAVTRQINENHQTENQPFGRNARRWPIFWGYCSFLLICTLIYRSVLRYHFATADDACNLLNAHKNFYVIFIGQGRLIESVLARWMFISARDMGGLGWWRFACLCGLAILANLLCSAMIDRGFPWKIAAPFALIICCLPAMPVYVTMVESGPMPLTAAIAGAGALAAVKARKQSRTGRRVGWAAIGVIAFVVALLIYQPAAMFFWVFVALDLFRPVAPPKDPLRHFFFLSIIGAAALALGFVGVKIGGLMQPVWVAPTRTLISPSEIPMKVKWFFSEPLFDSLNLVDIFPKQWIAVAVACVDTVGLLLYFSGSFARRCLLFLLALALIPLSYLPNLLVHESWASYRTQVALSGLISLYTLLALYGILSAIRVRAALPWITIIAAGACAINCDILVTDYYAWPLAVEWRFVMAQLTPARLANVAHIRVIPANWNDGIAPGNRYDEYGAPCTSAPWGAPALVELAVREHHPELSHVDVLLATYKTDVLGTYRNGAQLRLDMRTLRSLRGGH
jgi:hypothetical protein